MAKRRSLEALDARIDRKELTLRDQTLKAERLSRSTGVSRETAMARVARAQVASQKTGRSTARSTTRKFTPSGPPKRDPFGPGRKPTGKKITRRGGRQPASGVKKVTIVRPAARKKKKK